MYKVFVLSLFAAAVVSQMTQAMRNQILNDHNTKRRTAGASNMIELRYDMLLEQTAQNYLQNTGCAGGFQHNPNRGCDYTALGGTNGGSGSCASVGENWYSGYPDNSSGVDVVIGGAVSQWTDGTCASWSSPPLKCASTQCSEKQNFYQTGSDSWGACNQNNGQWLHYTQVMWATTAWVGCGYTATCGTVCDYASAGNMNLPTVPVATNLWKAGTPCSACPSGYTNCDNGLCSATTSSSTTASTAAPTITSCAADNTNKPTNGNVGTCAYNTAIGSYCAQICNTGYSLTSGSLSRQCKSGGVWAATTAVCSAVTCADSITQPINGNAGTCATSKTYGQTCQMACNSGYTFTSGSLTRTCGSSGSFSSASAVCTATGSAPSGTTAPATTARQTYAPATTTLAPVVVAPGAYCNSGPLSADDSHIGSVSLVGNGNWFNETSGCPGTIGPLELTNLHSTVSPGRTYKLNMLRNTCGDWYVAIIGAWIDWNQDYTWSSSELLFPFSQSIGQLTFSFTVPSSAKSGATRMRIQVQEIATTSTTTIDPCAMFEWGDTKDFTIIVAASTAAETAQVTATTVCIPDNTTPINGGPGTCASIGTLGSTCTQVCDAGFTLTAGTLVRECTQYGYSTSNAICA